MFEDNQAREINEQETISWGVVIAVVLLLLASLGGMLYAFLIPVQ